MASKGGRVKLIQKACLDLLEDLQTAVISKPNTLLEFINQYTLYSKLNFDYQEFFYEYSGTKINDFLNYKTKTDLLIYEAPPSSGKTFITRFSAVYQALNEPFQEVLTAPQYLFVFGSAKLKNDFVSRTKGLLNSKYVISIYGNQFNKPHCIQNQERLVLANGTTLLFTTQSSESPTGTRFKYIYLIDYLTASTFNSPAKKDRAFTFLDGFLTRTQLNPNTKIILDNQRLGREDLTEVLIDRFSKQDVGFEYIRFPYIFTKEWQALNMRTFNLNGKVHIFEENSFLLKRFNENTLRVELAKLHERTFQIQYQGIVDNIAGEIIDEIDFMEYGEQDLLQTNFTKLIITIDTALKPKSTSDFSVISLFGFDGKSVFLLDYKRGKWLFSEFETQLEVFLEKWKNGLRTDVKHKYIDLLRIEDNSQGSVLYNSITSKSSNISLRISNIITQYRIKFEAFNPKKSKYERLSPFLSFIKKHKIFIPSSHFTNFTEHHKTIAFKKEMLEFSPLDTHINDDIVDTFVSACEIFYVARPTMQIQIYD